MNTSLNSLINSHEIKDSYLEFLTNEPIEIFCPFIKKDTLKTIIKHEPTISRIISRWDPREIINGASDIEVYEICKENNIDFYINKRIHLKATIKSKDSVFHSSANLTSRGVNFTSTEIYNYELSSILKLQGYKDLVYFEEIVQDSIFVTDDVYKMMYDFLQSSSYEVNETDPFSEFEKMKKYYISQLPNSRHPKILYDIYSENTKEYSDVEVNSAIHDLAIFKVRDNLDYATFLKDLKKSFFGHPFISGLMYEVENEGFIYFGRVKEWLHNNCKDVPVPKRRELTEITQILYKWIEVLGGDKFIIDRPNHSQRIRVLE